MASKQEVQEYVDYLKAQGKPEQEVAEYANYLSSQVKDQGEQDGPLLKFAKDTGKSALKGVVSVGRAIDSYTGAPTRAFIGAAQDQALPDAKNPFAAFADQFGENPDLAPTGKQIAAKTGLSTKETIEIPGLSRWIGKVSPAGIAGVGVEVLGDYSTLVNPAKVVGLAGKGAKEAAKATGKGVAMVGNKLLTKGDDVAKVAAQADNVSTAAKVVSGITEDTKKMVSNIFSPKRADDFQTMVQVAQKNKIDPSLLPESVEFGENSLISRVARTQREGPLGESALLKFQEGLDQVKTAVDNKIMQAAGGVPPTPVQAGIIVRDGFDAAVDKFFQSQDLTYSKIMDAAPGLLVSPDGIQKINSKLSGIEKFAKGRVLRGINKTQREQGKQLLAAVSAVRNGNGSYKQTYEALSDIGEVAFKSKYAMADIPPDIEKLRDLYFTTREALLDTVKQTAGEPVYNELIKANKEISEFIKKKDLLESTIKNSQKGPEEVFDAIVKRGNTIELETLKGILPPEQFNQVRGAFLESIIKRDVNGEFTFKSIYNALRANKNALAVLFSPQEIADIVELVQLGDRFGTPIMSTSGTGASRLLSNLPASVQQTIADRGLVEFMKNRARKGVQTAPDAAQAVNQSSQVITPSSPQTAAMARRLNLKPNIKLTGAAAAARAASYQDRRDESQGRR